VPLRILLAEDDPVLQQMTAALLRERGHEVSIVQTGREAVEAVRSGRFQVVLMDLQMPELDGIGATEQIRRFPQYADLPIIAVTALPEAEVRERCLAARMTGFLRKPVSPPDLVAAVEGPGTSVRAPLAAAPGPAPSAPADLDGLRRSMRAAGVEYAVAGIIQAFVREAPARMSALEAAVLAGEATRICQAAHAYRSAAATIAARGLADALRQMETAGRAGDPTGAAGLLEQARVAHDAVLMQLRTSAGT